MRVDDDDAAIVAAANVIGDGEEILRWEKSARG